MVTRILAAVLYPFLNPVAFVVRFLKEKVYGEQLKKDNQNAVRKNQEFKKNLRDKINHLNLGEESSKAILDRFNAQEKITIQKFEEFKNNHFKANDTWIKSHTVWDKPETITAFNAIYQEASNNFTLLLLAIQKAIAEKSLDNTEKLAIEIVKQGGDGFAFPLFGATVLGFYEIARGKPYYYVWPGNGVYAMRAPDCIKHENFSEFYTDGTPQNEWRKIHNVYAKQFYTLFGGEELRKVLSGPNSDKGGDKRINGVLSVDTSKNEMSFGK